MADVYNYIQSTGVIVPDTTEIQSTLNAEYRQALGQNLVVTPDTIAGTLIAEETTARVSVAQNNAALANQINPNESGGIFLDGLCAMLGLERAPATRTVIPGATVSGTPGTTLPMGTQARTVAGDLFRTSQIVILDALGVATVDFVADVTGPISATVGSLTQVVDMVLGWESVTNSVAGVLGNLQQSDASLRATRNRTLARQTMSVSDAITSDLYDPTQTPGVRSLQFRENISDSPATIDGVPMVAHSVYLCVDGGDDADIANVLLRSKTAGANWNGNVTVNITDSSSGQSYPVKFSRPEIVTIITRVTVSRGRDLSDPLISVPTAIENYANGLMPNEDGLVVGQDASPFEFAAAVNYYHPGMTVKKLEVGTESIPYSTTTVPINLTQKAVVQRVFIQVIIV